MGGIAFSLKDPRGLRTPRMPPKIYKHIRDKCHSALRRRFLAVASPIEAPAKRDYGDVDVFVAWDVEQTPLGDFEDIGKLLGAPYARVADLVNCDAQFALPWPDEIDDHKCSSADQRPRYCQIDLHICKTIEDFHWNIWYYAHGDLLPMMNTMLRPFDLVCNHRGMFLRMPEIRKGRKKVFVTNEPSRALRLLGYDPTSPIWEKEFQDLDELFEHSANCRFFPGFLGIELTGEDGRIMAVRETFRAWVRDFVPTCLEGYPRTAVSKDALREEISAMFPETKAEYDLAFLKVERCKKNELLSQIMESSIPQQNDIDPHWRDNTIAALREIIVDMNYRLGFAPTRSLTFNDGLYDEVEVKAFVEDAWELVGDAAWERRCTLQGRNGQESENLAFEALHVHDKTDFIEMLESDDDEDVIRFPPRPEGYRQTWWDSDMNDI